MFVNLYNILIGKMAAVVWILNLAIEEKRRLKLMRRHLCDVSDPFSVPEVQFIQLYRYIYMHVKLKHNM